MAKRRNPRPGAGRDKPAPRRESGRHVAQPLVLARTPSAPTLFRFPLVDAHARQTTQQLLSTIKPLIWLRDREHVNQIKHAQTAAEVVERVNLATGLAEDTWHERMRAFGPEVLPLMAERLRTARRTYRKQDVDVVYEKLIAELRWRGDAGAEVLMDCFDDLNDYGKCLASVALGLLGARSSADRLWAFYQETRHDRHETYLVGALWGLVSLQDVRATDALVELLLHRRLCYELFGFFSLVGDARAVGPLLWAATQLPSDDSRQPLMALVSVAHRIGRAALITEFEKIGQPGEPRESREAAADQILAQPASQAQEFFALFYRGVTSEEAANVMDELRFLPGR